MFILLLPAQLVLCVNPLQQNKNIDSMELNQEIRLLVNEVIGTISYITCRIRETTTNLSYAIISFLLAQITQDSLFSFSLYAGIDKSEEIVKLNVSDDGDGPREQFHFAITADS